MSSEITNSQDIIDSRDVMARIKELDEERESLANAFVVAQDALYDPSKSEEVSEHKEAITDAQTELEDWDEENGEELKNLKALTEEGEGYGDWQHGATLIRDSYFEDYAKQTAEDLGLISSETQWPATCIDWEKAAKELKQDYTCVDFAGEDYYIRS
jgi:hypothetical protein